MNIKENINVSSICIDRIIEVLDDAYFSETFNEDAVRKMVYKALCLMNNKSIEPETKLKKLLRCLNGRNEDELLDIASKVVDEVKENINLNEYYDEIYCDDQPLVISLITLIMEKEDTVSINTAIRLLLLPVSLIIGKGYSNFISKLEFDANIKSSVLNGILGSLRFSEEDRCKVTRHSAPNLHEISNNLIIIDEYLSAKMSDEDEDEDEDEEMDFIEEQEEPEDYGYISDLDDTNSNLNSKELSELDLLDLLLENSNDLNQSDMLSASINNIKSSCDLSWQRENTFKLKSFKSACDFESGDSFDSIFSTLSLHSNPEIGNNIIAKVSEIIKVDKELSSCTYNNHINDHKRDIKSLLSDVSVLLATGTYVKSNNYDSVILKSKYLIQSDRIRELRFELEKTNKYIEDMHKFIRDGERISKDNAVLAALGLDYYFSDLNSERYSGFYTIPSTSEKISFKDLCLRTDEDILAIHGVGPVTLTKIKSILKEKGLIQLSNFESDITEQIKRHYVRPNSAYWYEFDINEGKLKLTRANLNEKLEY